MCQQQGEVERQRQSKQVNGSQENRKLFFQGKRRASLDHVRKGVSFFQRTILHRWDSNPQQASAIPTELYTRATQSNKIVRRRHVRKGCVEWWRKWCLTGCLVEPLGLKEEDRVLVQWWGWRSCSTQVLFFPHYNYYYDCVIHPTCSCTQLVVNHVMGAVALPLPLPCILHLVVDFCGD